MIRHIRYSLINFFIKGNFKKNDVSKKIDNNDIELSLDDVVFSSEDSKQLVELMELFIEFDTYLPTNNNHLNTNNKNHLNEIKNLRLVVSKIRVSLKPCFKIISKLDSKNFILHDSIMSCGMILGFLQAWDEHDLLTKNQYKNLNLLLVIFSSKMHEILSEIKV